MKIILRAAPTLLLLLTIWSDVSFTQAGDFTSQLAEREAVQKAVDFLIRGSADWVRERGCFTCHASGLGAFVAGLSARNGYVVNQHEYDINARFVLSHLHPDAEGTPPDGHQPIGAMECRKCHRLADGNGNVSLIALMGSGFALGRQTASRGFADQTGDIAKRLLVEQTEKGEWKPDYNRPVITSGNVMTSALCSVVLKESASLVQDVDKSAKAIQVWQKSLDRSALTKTTDVAFALLGTASFEASGSSVNELKSTLFELQNSDGGWSWQKGEGSNIVATGQALFALAASGVPRDEPHVGAAIDFLFARQKEDGTWAPVGEGKDFNKFVQRFTRTAWAVTGLSTILDVNGLIAKRSEVIKELEQTLADGQEDEKLQRLARIQLLLQDVPGAVKSCEQLIAMSPQVPAYRLALARTYLATGDRTKAAAAYQEALKTELPTETRGSVLLTTAECFEQIGQRKKAASIYLQLADPQGSLSFTRARRLLARVTALDTELKLSERYGIVTGWEVCGPFPNKGDDGFITAHAPEKGEESPWKRFDSDDPAGLFELSDAIEGATDVCGYARLRVSSPNQKQAQLRLGSDGPVAVWLNEKEVHRREGTRSVAFDQDRVEVSIPKGQSTLLIKVGQNKQKWGLVLRLTDATGKALNDVKTSPAAAQVR
ncbi:MAG: hypothetical protein QGF00_31180 [Planctomycetota bacterium]|jgi:tetratricopeptide (TPR) repeat protein|nr:hypothetical protein [Planctomycetota bacterium]HJN11691.1 hypothetical protein [Pirellulaceae bacterium]